MGQILAVDSVALTLHTKDLMVTFCNDLLMLCCLTGLIGGHVSSEQKLSFLMKHPDIMATFLLFFFYGQRFCAQEAPHTAVQPTDEYRYEMA